MPYESHLVLEDGRTIVVAGELPKLTDRLLAAAVDGRTVLVRTVAGGLVPIRPGSIRHAADRRIP
jgi:hypothetical protein